MKHGEAVQLAPSDVELERAIASVPGVASAAIDRSEETGRSRLRLRLGAGEDAEAVAWAVAATLRERFGIALDPAAIRARTMPHGDPATDPVRLVREPQPAEVSPPRQTSTSSGSTRERLGIVPSPDTDEPSDVPARWPSVGGEPPRVAIIDLDVQVEDQRVQVVATLGRLGRTVQGTASSLATTRGQLRAVAEATVEAVQSLTGGALRIGVDDVSVQSSDQPVTAMVVLALLTPAGEDHLVGASIVRADTSEAVMRATLDALNRRLAAWFSHVDATSS